MGQKSKASKGEGVTQFSAAGMFLMVAIWALGLGVYEFRTWEPAHSTHAQEVASAPKATTPVKSVRKMESDLSLGGLDLDMTVDEVHKAIGKEDTIKTKNKYHFLEYTNMEVGVRDDDIVHSLVSNGASVQTKRGIHEGSTFAEVKKAYGTDYYKMDNDDLTLYEYPFKSLKGHEGLLRFAIKKSDQTVKYISVRIPEEQKSEKDSSTTNEDIQVAEKILTRYYKAITDGRFWSAYCKLAYEAQEDLGGPTDLVQKYDGNISCNVSNIRVLSAQKGKAVVIGYVLTKRDQAPGNSVRVQIFNSKATVIYDAGEWRIRQIELEKQEEHKE